MWRSVCNAGASNGGRSLCVQISRELPPANILTRLERQLIALQLCLWQCLYNETLQQTFRRVLSKLSKRRQIYVIYTHFEEVRGGVEPWLMARRKACVWLPIRHNWTFFASSYRWGTTRQNVSRVAAIRRGVWVTISGGRSRPWGIFFGFYKTRQILLSDSANCTVLRAVVLTQYRRVTDGRTADRQNCHIIEIITFQMRDAKCI